MAQAIVETAKAEETILREEIAEAIAEAKTPQVSTASLSAPSPAVVPRPAARPTTRVAAAAGQVDPQDDSQREVVTRLSTSGGKHWGINVGRYTSRYQAEKVLLRTALAEMSALDGSLRKVVRGPRGFDANFHGMTRESADLACRRLQARNVSCFMVGPG